MRPEFWHGKKVFLTGHTGFKGSWLSLWLQQLGAQLTGYALEPPTNPSLFNEACVADGMTSVIGNVCDYPKLLQSLQACQPEIVIHMAAQPLVRYSYQNPVDTYATNVMGTVHLLEAVRHTASVKAVVNVTTDKCYENQEWVWAYRENEPMGGYDPYSNSKGCSELVTSAYRNSFFNPRDYQKHGVALASARAGNVIGGGDWAEDRLVPDFFRAIESNIPIAIRNPLATRPWQHVLEPLSGYLVLVERLWENPLRYAGGWNFGPEPKDIKPVGWIVERLVDLWGESAAWVQDGGDHPHEAMTLALDISKAKYELKWSPRLELERALDMIVRWEKARRNDVDMRVVSLQQIQEFVGNVL